MCASISEVKSSSLRLRPNMALAFRPLRSQNSSDGPCQSLPFVGFFNQLLAPGRRQRIKPRLAVVRRNSPLRRDPPALFQPLQRRIEGAVLNEQLFLRCFLDNPCDPLPVLRSKDQRAQNQQVQRPLQQFQSFFVILGRHITRVSTPSGKMST